MITVTFLLDEVVKVREAVIEVEATTTDVAFLHTLRNITYSMVSRDARIMRIEVNCAGTQTWTTVAEVMADL